MTLSTASVLSVQNAPGSLYLFAAKTSYSSSVLADKIKELFALLYTDGNTKQTLNSVSPWAVLDANGIKCKLKQEAVTFDPNDAAPYTIGYQHLSGEVEITINDLTAEKLAEILSTGSSSSLTLAASSTQPGQTTNVHGGETYPTIYCAIYRYPSRKIANEFDHVVIPYLTFNVDSDYELSKKGIRSLKVKGMANGDPALVTTDTAKQIVWIEHRATAAKSV